MIISFKVINRDENAKADAGVAMGRIKAKLLGRITVMAAKAGLIPNSGLMLNTGGIKMAITAELLMNVVRRKERKAVVMRNPDNDCSAGAKSCSASQSAAPVSAMAFPRQIAPPYIKMIAQFT